MLPEKRVALIRLSVFSSVFTVLVFVATVSIVVATPATRGFFNLGETMVYTAALFTLNPLIATVAGGLGSALADLYLGYGHYAPGTLVIKGVEGLLVVLLVQAFKRVERWWRPFLIGMTGLVSVLIGVYGCVFYSGETVLAVAGREIVFTIPKVFWIGLAAALAAIVLLIGLRIDNAVGFKSIALLLAGLEMVTGYFLYQVLVLGYSAPVAATEIPVNVGQALIGLAVALPLVEALRGMGIRLAGE
ncbi:ECF transporter S component [archaeon]|nr:ECF transporter S component [archaeon]